MNSYIVFQRLVMCGLLLSGGQSRVLSQTDSIDIQKMVGRHTQSLANFENCRLQLTSRTDREYSSLNTLWSKKGPLERVDTARVFGGQNPDEVFTTLSSTFFDRNNDLHGHFSQRVKGDSSDIDATAGFVPRSVENNESYQAWRAPLFDSYIHHDAVLPLMLRISQIAQDKRWSLESLVEASDEVLLEWEGMDPKLIIRHPGVNGLHQGERIYVVLDAKHDYLIRKVTVGSIAENWQTEYIGDEFSRSPDNTFWYPSKTRMETSSNVDGKFVVQIVRNYSVKALELPSPWNVSFRFPDNALIKVIPVPVTLGGTNSPKECDVELYKDGKVEKTIAPAEFEQFISDRNGIPIEALERPKLPEVDNNKKPWNEYFGFQMAVALSAVFLTWAVWRRFRPQNV